MGGWDVDPVLLWSSDGTGALGVGATGNHHTINLSEAAPPSVVVDTGGTDDYVRANLSTIDVRGYDYFGLHSVTKVEAGALGVAETWTSSALAIYATGVIVGPQEEADPDLADPTTTVTAGTANIPPHNRHILAAHTNDTAATGAALVCDGTVTIFDNWGFHTTGGQNLSTTDKLNTVAWIGYGAIQALASQDQVIPRITWYDQLKLQLNWFPVYAGTIATPVRIKGKIWGLKVRQNS